MWHSKAQGAENRSSVRAMFTMLLLAILALLAACGSSASKAKVTPVPPTATPPPKGWNTVASPPVGSEGNLIAVTALSAGDAWAMGSYHRVDAVEVTLIEHWDGSAWAQVPSPNSSQRFNILSAVAAISSTDVWAVGSAGTAPNKNEQLIEHWDGKTWTIMPNPTISQGSSALTGVAAISASDAWAAGLTVAQASAGGYHQEPLVEHWDGASWKVVASAVLSENSQPSSFNAVTAIGSKDVWAVGTSSQGALIEHWDGATWKIISGATGVETYGGLTGISATSSSDVWAVGSGVHNSTGGGCGNGGSIAVEHWDGVRWSNIPFAGGPSYNLTFNTIAAVATNDVWMVGGAETSRTNTHSFIAPVIEHWDGARWSNVTSPTISTHGGFAGVAALRGGPSWVVGQAELSNGSGPTVIEQWNGSQWASVPSPSPGTLSNELNGVTSIAPKDIWAVGSSTGGTLAEHWDGTSWSVFPTANGNGVDNVLNGVAGTAPNDVWAVGYTAGSYGQGLIQHWDGSRWSVVPGSSASTGPLFGIATLTTRDAWAVGREIQHWDGSRWTTIPKAQFNLADAYQFYGIAAVSSSDIWAVGGSPLAGCSGTAPSLIEHWNGAKWSVIPNTPEGILYGVSAVSSTDVWAVGSKYGAPAIMHWDGKQWSDTTLTTRGLTLESVSARASNDVWAVGFRYDQNSQQVAILHWDGHAWTAAQATGPGLSGNALAGVCTISANEAWAVGYYSHAYGPQQSLIMRYIA